MKIFVTSDTHFNHKKLIEYGRPADFEEKLFRSIMNSKGDLLIHCGDFCIGQEEKSMMDFHIASMNFKKKILVRGNHDNKPDGWYLDRGFDFVCDTFTAKYFGKKLIFSHMPMQVDKIAFDRNIHGHLHGNNHRASEFEHIGYFPEWHYDLAPELHDYKIVDLENVLRTQVQKYP